MELIPSRLAKKLLFASALIIPLPTLAQSLFLYPKTSVAPRGSYQSVTAIVSGANDKSVSWTSDGGTIVGTNPCVVNEPCTVALYAAAAGTYHLKATSSADGSLEASSTITFTPSPKPALTHPRLLVTSEMLPGLRAKATAGNTIYQAIKSSATSRYYTPDNAIWSWSCNGGSGLPSTVQSGNYRENDANTFAFLSMVAPTSVERNAWGCYGRDVWVYVMNQVLAGNEVIGGNHWSDNSPSFALTTDWLMAGGYLSPSDQVIARKFLAFMAKTVLNYSYGFSAPVNTFNSPSEFNTGKTSDLVDMRTMGNNYTMSKMLMLAAVSLTFNDTADDDPPLANTCGASRDQVCPDFSAGSLHAYWDYMDGAMLYLDYAHLEDPNVSWQAYNAAYGNLPTRPTCLYIDGSSHPCFGDGRGGESSEGSWYGYSIYRLRDALNMIHTAGYDDPILYGPQISLGTSSWWDLKYVFDLSFLTGASAQNGPGSSWGGVAPAYSYLTTGDSNTYYRMPADFLTEAAAMTYDTYTGRTDRTAALKWPILNTAFGGPLGNQDNCITYCGFDSEMSNDFAAPVTYDLFISLPAADPVADLPTDPRPSIPTDLYNGGLNQHMMVRSGWSVDSTLFSYYCPNSMIDHEHQFCGRFDVFSGGEYITKGRTEFNDYNDQMSSSTESNELSIANATGNNCASTSCSQYFAAASGGQFWHAEQAGLNSLQHSELPAYAAAIADTTNDYNGIWAWSSPHDVPSYNDVSHASRSLVFLRESNQVVFYDRAVTNHASSKDLYQIATGVVNISGNRANWLTRSGKQSVYFTSLLPAGAVVSEAAIAAGHSDQSSDWEPQASVHVSAGTTQSTRFLTAMEWGPLSLAPTKVSLIQSTSGTQFDGALMGSSLVLFKRNWADTFGAVTYRASGAEEQYVADLTPNEKYLIAGEGTPGSATSDAAGVLVFSASGSGNITVATVPPSLSSISILPSSIDLAIGKPQQYTATCEHSDGTKSDCTSTVAWASSATGAVTIKSSGLATALAQGSAVISASSSSIEGRATVTVPLPAPVLSPAAGTYTSTQKVAIASKAPGAIIHYTTNGTGPTANSPVYSTPIIVSVTETVKAVAMATGYLNSGLGAATYTIMPPAATPVFSPAAGTYNAKQKITIATKTPSAKIHYTTNGSTPTANSPVVTGPIAVAASETIKAIACATGFSNSAMGSAGYTIK